MYILDIPFVRHLGIKTGYQPYELVLPFNERYTNHLGTWFAGVEFSLAEAASGYCLFELFAEYRSGTIPLLRESRIKFSKPSKGTLRALPEPSGKEITRFQQEMESKGKARIVMPVNVLAGEDQVIARAEFVWYVIKENTNA